MSGEVLIGVQMGPNGRLDGDPVTGFTDVDQLFVYTSASTVLVKTRIPGAEGHADVSLSSPPEHLEDVHVPRRGDWAQHHQVELVVTLVDLVQIETLVVEQCDQSSHLGKVVGPQQRSGAGSQVWLDLATQPIDAGQVGRVQGRHQGR